VNQENIKNQQTNYNVYLALLSKHLESVSQVVCYVTLGNFGLLKQARVKIVQFRHIKVKLGLQYVNSVNLIVFLYQLAILSYQRQPSSLE